MVETSARLLRLRSLSQTPRARPGPELAARLAVSLRTIRAAVARLRRRAAGPAARSAGRLGQLDRVARRVLEQDLLPAAPDHEVVAEARAGRAQPLDGRGRSSTSSLKRFQPPGAGARPSGIDCPAARPHPAC